MDTMSAKRIAINPLRKVLFKPSNRPLATTTMNIMANRNKAPLMAKRMTVVMKIMKKTFSTMVKKKMKMLHLRKMVTCLL